MKKIFHLLLLLLCFVAASAQEIKVKSVKLLQNDITARTNPRLDGNDEPCALVKVIVPAVEGVQFEGWVIGQVGYRAGEYQVYVPAGTKKIKFRHPDFAPGEIIFSIPIESKCTYRVELDVPQKKGLESVEQGDAAALLKQAQNYEQGAGAYQKDLAQALIWYEKAAEAGSIEAQEYLANVLYAGTNGYAKDTEKALRWNEACAKRGKTESILRSAELNEKIGLATLAIEWYTKYESQRPAKELQMHIAQLYNNTAPQKNEWLRRAADNGHVEAAYELATRLVSTDATTAAVYYQKAIDAGHVKAMCDYGTMLMLGRNGITKDEAKGKALIEQAGRKGSIEATSRSINNADVEIAQYVAKMPELLNAVKQGDADAMLQLALIYRILGEKELEKTMLLIIRYNLSYDIPAPASFDPVLLQKANLLKTIMIDHYKTEYRTVRRYSYPATESYQRKITRSRVSNYESMIEYIGDLNKVEDLEYDTLIKRLKEKCVETRNAINEMFEYINGTKQLQATQLPPVLIDMAKSCHDIDIMKLIEQEAKNHGEFVMHNYKYPDTFKNWVKKSWGVAEPTNTQYDIRIINALKEYREQNKQGKWKKEIQWLGEWPAIQAADADITFKPILKQLKSDGFFWDKSMVDKAIKAKRESERREAEMAEQKAQQAVIDGIRSRGKAANYKTFEVKGVLFNMIRVKPNPKAKYSYWNGARNISAPKTAYYLAETEVTKELWNAVMGEGDEDSQRPYWIKDSNDWKVFQTFITKLNKLTGKRFRVPTIEEWEYAVHGGEISGTPFTLGGNLSGRALTSYDAFDGTPNSLGFYHITDGVTEFYRQDGYVTPMCSPGHLDHHGLRLALSAQ